ncbi:hypothetical protein EK21DRAFT_114283 [Setomelanomma holmii]|uniref:Uncharacterized protein n=1 Tax=Setomelanomma holmii TaxID=210430 RepID=A0A9P4H5J8_9PLEO|nr:hypothetical protein EK21DRAFT_114283 [Setomelanomma holmii]
MTRRASSWGTIIWLVIVNFSLALCVPLYLATNSYANSTQFSKHVLLASLDESANHVSDLLSNFLVSPWDTEYLPNPVIFPAAFALYKGYHALYNVQGATVQLEMMKLVQEMRIGEIGKEGVCAVVGTNQSGLEGTFRCEFCDARFTSRGLKT